MWYGVVAGLTLIAVATFVQGAWRAYWDSWDGWSVGTRTQLCQETGTALACFIRENWAVLRDRFEPDDLGYWQLSVVNEETWVCYLRTSDPAHDEALQNTQVAILSNGHDETLWLPLAGNRGDDRWDMFGRSTQLVCYLRPKELWRLQSVRLG